MFHRYAERLVALARSRLSGKLAQRLDPEGVVQSAYRNFVAGAHEGQHDLQRGGDLWRLLVKITLHKLHDQVKRHTADKRTVDAERNLAGNDSLSNFDSAFLAQGPSPGERPLLEGSIRRFPVLAGGGDPQPRPAGSVVPRSCTVAAPY